MSGHSSGGRLTAIASVVAFAVLALTLVIGIAPNFDTRLVGLAELAWPGYAADLRKNPEAPDCALEDLKTQLATCPTDGTTAEGKGGDPFGGEDPFAEPGAKAKAPADPFAGEDPFAEPAEEPKAKASADPFAGEDPFAEPAKTGAPADDPFAGGDPFADDAPAEPQVNCAALANLVDRCQTRHDEYNDINTRLTGSVKTFRSVELAVASLAKFPFWRQMLVFLLLAGAIATTAQRAHIALRTAESMTEHRVSQGSQLIAHLLLLATNIADYSVQARSTAEVDNPTLPLIWAAGFATLAAINLWHIAKPPSFGGDRGSNPLRLLMVIPLYAYMAMIAGVWFLGVEQHPSGQAIYLHKFAQHPSIYLGIGLYIWAGMLLSVTRIAPLTFDVLTPWKLPPAVTAWIVIVAAALPTAYSGASGIFVIAAGAVIFERLRAAGAEPRLALAATAMSGSLGVVLRPCLVVVLIAVLNKQVTTDELFTNGLLVFLLTAVLSLVVLLGYMREPFRMEAPGKAAAGSIQALKPLVPYVALSLVAYALYRIVLDTQLSEHTAALILPGIMLALVAYDRWGTGVLSQALTATKESSGHIGALLVLMAASVGLGGVVERAEVMNLVPESLGSPYIAMALLVIVMVLVGMTMDALGAVVLVSVTLAAVAYRNGIDPVHFWMMVLVAFELGYLTPPVAINHLLARQVIGPASHVEDDDAVGFMPRYYHIVLPMIVMATALLIVAFVPFLFYDT